LTVAVEPLEQGISLKSDHATRRVDQKSLPKEPSHRFFRE